MPCQYSSFSILLVCNEELANIDGALSPPNSISGKAKQHRAYGVLAFGYVVCGFEEDCKLL